jgi:excinuclease ABC subunit B
MFLVALSCYNSQSSAKAKKERDMPQFQLVSDFSPMGDQPEAINQLVEGINQGLRHQTLLGVTGSGKTYTVSQVIQRTQKATLVMAHNKTLAAQLYAEFKQFFPHNAVEYFVSYYDYYQPEAYMPQHDLYIEKDSQINDEIDGLRLAATHSLLSRNDVIIVASVSAIYGLGSPEDYGKVVVELRRGEIRKRNRLLRHLIDIRYERNDYDLKRGTFRVRGDTVEIMPAYEEIVYRIEFWGDEIERLTEVHALTGEVLMEHIALDIYPAKHFITPEDKLLDAIQDIKGELQERLKQLREMNKLLEAQRIEQRTGYDLEMLLEIGYCTGIENYSRQLSQRAPDSTPWTLLDYFPDDFLLVIDESHMSIPQIRGMYRGDRSRKETLVEYGFRLPSALDNRPLRFEEFDKHIHQAIYLSATPGAYENECSERIVQQVIRPTGIVDPILHLRPTKGQIDDLVGEINQRIKRGQRTLITTLTKRMSEDLSEYIAHLGIKVNYLHSEINTLERVEILRELRLGVYDVIVGINLLREGLDLPEVSLVAILDADKQGFLRSERALIQTIGRAARHIEGTVIMYADRISDAMQSAIDETNRRRTIQKLYNRKHGINPTSIAKAVKDLTDRVGMVAEEQVEYGSDNLASLPKNELTRMIEDLSKQMKAAAQELEFERAATLRDQINDLQQILDAQDKRPEWEKIREEESKD